MTNPMIDFISDDDIESLEFAITDAISEFTHDNAEFDPNIDDHPEMLIRKYRNTAILAIMHKLQFTPTFDELLLMLADIPAIPLDAREQLNATIRANFNS